MRILLIFLSIGLVFTLIQYSNGAPTKSIPSESEEDDNVETEAANILGPISDNNDQSDESDEPTTPSKPIAIEINENDKSSEERTKVGEALEFIQNFEEPYSGSVQQDDDHDDNDDQSNVARIVDNDSPRILRDDDED